MERSNRKDYTRIPVVTENRVPEKLSTIQKVIDSHEKVKDAKTFILAISYLISDDSSLEGKSLKEVISKAANIMGLFDEEKDFVKKAAEDHFVGLEASRIVKSGDRYSVTLKDPEGYTEKFWIKKILHDQERAGGFVYGKNKILLGSLVDNTFKFDNVAKEVEEENE